MTEYEVEIGSLRIALAAAEVVMDRIDAAVQNNRLDARSGIADARLDYAKPFTSRLATIRATTAIRNPNGRREGGAS